MYIYSEFCDIYGFMGFMISGNGIIELYEQKWRFCKMDWKLLLQYFMILEGETNDQKNLPTGWVLQGKSEQGMPSLSLLPENEEMATDSCGSIYNPIIWKRHLNFHLRNPQVRWTWRGFITSRHWRIQIEKTNCTA